MTTASRNKSSWRQSGSLPGIGDSALYGDEPDSSPSRRGCFARRDGGADLRGRIAHLERRPAILTAVLRLVLAVLRLSRFKVEFSRVPEATDKRPLLAAVERARRSMPLSAALRVLGLSSPHYHAWVRARAAAR